MKLSDMKNKTIEEKILLISDLFFTYLEVILTCFVVLIMISYGIDKLQAQKENHFLLQWSIFIVSVYISFFTSILFLMFVKKIFKHKQPKKSIIHIIGIFIPAYLIAAGIMDLQTAHYPEENYIYFGKPLIVIGILGIFYAQWRYKINKRKEKTIQ